MKTKRIISILGDACTYGLGACCGHYLMKGDGPPLYLRNAVVAGLWNVFVIEPEKMGSVKWTPHEKALVQWQLRDEEILRGRTGGLKENCKKSVWLRWGKEEKWKVVGKEGEVVSIEDFVGDVGESKVVKKVEGGKAEGGKVVDMGEEDSKMSEGAKKAGGESVEKVGVEDAETVKTSGLKTAGLKGARQDGVESVKKDAVEGGKAVEAEEVKASGLEVKQNGVKIVKQDKVEGEKKVGVEGENTDALEGIRAVGLEGVKTAGVEAAKKEDLAVERKIAAGSASGKDSDKKD